MIRARIANKQDATLELRQRFALDAIVGKSAALAVALEGAMLAAPLDVNVLLLGESGTGKSQLARIIHANSPRAAAPFVELNCAAIPETLLESELFGARAGSHSEARRDMPGKVEAAESGTLFLDEIGELSMDAQAKLLQLLQSKQYYPLGATTPKSADVRVIASTNAELEQRVRDKLFREDLFYRLNVLPVRMPTLAERPEDIRELAVAAALRLAKHHQLPALPLSPAALGAIRTTSWPGNVRQLENAVESALIRAAGLGASEIAPNHLFPELHAQTQPTPQTYQQATQQFQRELLLGALRDTEWNVSEAARRLDLARSHVYNLISAFGLEREGDKGT